MKTIQQIQDRINLLRTKIHNAKESGKGYDNFSDLRRDETTINALEWVIDVIYRGERKK
jgi:hypothetical protein